VWFLVHSDARQLSVNDAITDWRQGRAGVAVRARALTLPAAMAELTGSSTPATAPPIAVASAGGPLSTAEIALFRGFYSSAVTLIKTVRAAARGRNEPPPEYPAETQAVLAVLQRLCAPRGQR